MGVEQRGGCHVLYGQDSPDKSPLSTSLSHSLIPATAQCCVSRSRFQEVSDCACPQLQTTQCFWALGG